MRRKKNYSCLGSLFNNGDKQQNIRTRPRTSSLMALFEEKTEERNVAEQQNIRRRNKLRKRTQPTTSTLAALFADNTEGLFWYFFFRI